MVTSQLAGTITEDSIYITWQRTPVCILTQRMNDACEEEYVFTPLWDVWDRIQPGRDIPGLNMSLRRKEYVRWGKPGFMIESMPPFGIEDLPWCMERVGLTGEYDVWDFMIAQGRVCGVDKFRVERIPAEQIAKAKMLVG